MASCSAAIDRDPSGGITANNHNEAAPFREVEPSPKACESPHSDQDLVHTIVVRADLSPGQMIAQAIHAAGESSPGPIPKNTVALALAAKDQVHLLAIAAKLTKAGIPFSLISECDGEAMAIGINPMRDRKKLRKVTSSLPLAGRDLAYDLHTVKLQRIEIDRLRAANDQLRAANAKLQASNNQTWWRRFTRFFTTTTTTSTSTKGA
jgi:peptidyl-tRNA hydrolase